MRRKFSDIDRYCESYRNGRNVYVFYFKDDTIQAVDQMNLKFWLNAKQMTKMKSTGSTIGLTKDEQEALIMQYLYEETQAIECEIIG